MKEGEHERGRASEGGKKETEDEVVRKLRRRCEEHPKLNFHKQQLIRVPDALT